MKQLFSLEGILFCLFILLSTNVSAQQKALIRGTVISAQDKLPLIQASVVERNSDDRTVSSTVTNLDGNFSLNVTDTRNKLVISYMGYKTKEIPVGSNTAIKIELEEDNQMLSEVVITAKPKSTVGNLQIDDRDISMSIAKLSAGEIADLHVASIDEAIQGRMAGIDIVSNAGDPGSGMSIRIRGTTSINGDNQPMIVVDGIPLETEIGADFDFSTASEEEFSQLLNVAPADIKDIVVLKDAAATAIWGSKAANGVLQITTQRGTVSPPKVTFRGTYSLSPLPPAVPTLTGDEWSTMILEAHLNRGEILDPLVHPEVAYDPNNPEYYYNYSNNTDWVKAVSQTGYAQDYNLSVRGGSNKVRYSFSTGYYDQKGNTIETGLQRINTRMNLDYFVSDKLRFSADIAYTHSNNQRNFVPNDDKDKYDVRTHAYKKMPNQSIYYINERGEQTPLYFTPVSNLQGSYPGVFNPVAMARDGEYTIISEKIIPHLNIAYVPNLTWRYTVDVAFDAGNDKRKKFLPQTATGLQWWNNQTNWTSEKDDESFVIQTFNKLFFTPQNEDQDRHRLIGLIGVNTYDRSSYSYYAATSNLASPLLKDPSIESRIYPGGEIKSEFGQQRTVSTYANVNYTFLDRYTVFGNIAYNGDSRFGKNYRYGLFPAVSGRYRISGESFMKDWTWLDDFSLRASWGITGKAPKKDYLFYNRYNTYNYSYMGENATYPAELELSELRWEECYQNNFGINLVAMDYKLNIEFDYYIRSTKNQYMENTAIPSTSGYSKMRFLNYGTLENKGFELSINYTPVRTKNWNLNFAFNLARSENRITQISEYIELYEGNWDENGKYLSRTILNQPVGAFYGYLYDGVYVNKEQTIARDKSGNPIYTVDNQGRPVPTYMKFGYSTVNYEFQPGDARYVDVNHDGNINYQDIVYLGDYNPLFTGGLTPSVKYRNFSLNTVFYFRYGNDIINMARMEMENMYYSDNQSKAVLKRFRQEYENPAEAPADLLPRALYGVGYNWLASDRFVEDGSFLRWKSITFRYNFKKDWITRFKLSDLYFYFTMQNIYVWTNYTGQDPEVSITGENPGRDFARAPIPKTYTFGVNLTF
ncbi:MAG: SusC/RagA family TonB-linked outer membrane protein [Dysgonamonadaceae bacterium]|jgi:TonB-linked SusC/RagA family outer membrane protein|nr:SusC/RagA family TonB-linked outer membrane protein [Dysgonamonadaceae bacterium]